MHPDEILRHHVAVLAAEQPSLRRPARPRRRWLPRPALRLAAVGDLRPA